MSDIPKIARCSMVKAIETLMAVGARKATVYQHPKLTIKATRILKPNKRDRSTTLVLTMGAPNYEERAFIKKCLKAQEPFPVRKVQLKHYPEKRP